MCLQPPSCNYRIVAKTPSLSGAKYLLAWRGVLWELTPCITLFLEHSNSHSTGQVLFIFRKSKQFPSVQSHIRSSDRNLFSNNARHAKRIITQKRKYSRIWCREELPSPAYGDNRLLRNSTSCVPNQTARRYNRWRRECTFFECFCFYFLFFSSSYPSSSSSSLYERLHHKKHSVCLQNGTTPEMVNGRSQNVIL